MAGSLEGVLARIPGLGGYLGGQEQDRVAQASAQQQQIGQLQQVGALQGILAKVEAAKKQQQAAQQEQERLGALAAARTPEERLAINARYAGADAGMRVDTAHLDRQATMEAARVNQNTQREARAAELVQAHQFKLAEIKQRSTDDATKARETLAAQQEFRREMAQFAVANRPPRAEPQVQPLVQIIGPDGQPTWAERKDAVGKRPAGAGSKAEAVAAGKTDVDKDVVTLKASLDQLNEGGGITSTEKGVVKNVARWASTTGPGQLLGAMGGTHNQKARDVIAQARPLLLRSIMQSTGMSAKQLDSNAELKLWLSTATDPTKGYEANVEALNNISAKYGTGPLTDSAQQAGGKINPKPSRRLDDVPPGIDPKVWGAMTPEEKKLFK